MSPQEERCRSPWRTFYEGIDRLAEFDAHSVEGSVADRLLNALRAGTLALLLGGCHGKLVPTMECITNADCDAGFCSPDNDCLTQGANIVTMGFVDAGEDAGVSFIESTSDCHAAPFFNAVSNRRHPLRHLDTCRISNPSSPCLGDLKGSTYYFAFKADGASGSESSVLQLWRAYAYTPYTTVAIYVLDDCGATSCSNENTAASSTPPMTSATIDFTVPSGATRIVAIDVDGFCDLQLPLVMLERLD